MNQYFSAEEIQMFKKYMKKCSELLPLREMKIKLTTRYKFTSVRKASFKKTKNNKYWQRSAKKGN